MLRHLGLAARFVSGYLIQLAPDEKSLDGPSGPERDFTDLHAWCEVYLPGAGWIGLDATSGLLAGEGHIPLSCTPEPSSAAPVSGAVDECEAKLQHEMRVTRIYESPRVTKPYSDEQWGEIQALGHAVDADLAEHDVPPDDGRRADLRFDGRSGRRGMEFHRGFGPKKRVLAGDLIRRLRAKFAPGALLHYGQGKWYPGESLPRWALGCYWRKDGVPIWKDDSLIADESKDYGLRGARSQGTGLAHRRPIWACESQWLHPRLRGRFLLHLERAPAAVQRDAGEIEPEKHRRSATGWRRFFQKGWARSSATRCRSSAASPAESRAG